MNSNVPIIIKLNSDSASRLAQIELESNSPPWGEKVFFTEFTNQHAIVFGVRLRAEIVAFLVIHHVMDEAHIVNFAVAAEKRGQGIGRELIQYVVNHMHILGVRWITLEVRQGNSAARKLYDSLGFFEIGKRKGYYADNAEDAVVLNLSVVEFVARLKQSDTKASSNLTGTAGFQPAHEFASNSLRAGNPRSQ